MHGADMNAFSASVRYMDANITTSKTGQIVLVYIVYVLVCVCEQRIVDSMFHTS